MAIPSFSAFHDEGINLEGLLEILSPEKQLGPGGRHDGLGRQRHHSAGQRDL